MNKDYNQLFRSIESRYNPESSAAVEQRAFTNLAGVEKRIAQYVKMSMTEVDEEYTNKTLQAGEAVKAHLQAEQNSVSYEYQGSVMTRTHIRGVSDIDLLTLCEKFHNTEIFKIRNILNTPYNNYSYHNERKLQNYSEAFSLYEGNAFQDLKELRLSNENIMQKHYYICDVSKPKSIKIKNLHYNREVDIVTATWLDTVDYIINDNDKTYRGVKIYDKEKEVTLEPDYPFLSISRINSRSSETNGRLKKMIRFLKNVRTDSSRKIDLSSFDINAVCYDIDIEKYRDAYYLQLVPILFSQLYSISNDNGHADRIKSVDGMEYIFRNHPDKLNNLRLLMYEVCDILTDLRKENIL